MSESNDPHDAHSEIADAFGRTNDPLEEYDDQFKSIDVDPFELYQEERVEPKDYSQGHVSRIERNLRTWKEWMEQYERHPACPNERHVREYATHWMEHQDVTRRYVNAKLNDVRSAIEYFQEEASFPHSMDYNPVSAAKGKLDLSWEDPKDPYPLSLEELKNRVRAIKHIRDRAIIGSQCKLGFRANELCNVMIEEVHISNSDLLDHYGDMGRSRHLEGHQNAIFVPHDREGNKSERPRVVPLDDELRRLLLDWLLIRPDMDEPWLFLSKERCNQMIPGNVNDIWLDHFRPEYGPTERYRGISSHYGRHFFSTWMHEETSASRAEVKYMRGDKQKGGTIRSTSQAIDSYIHVYYDDIKKLYRSEIFKFRL